MNILDAKQLVYDLLAQDDNGIPADEFDFDPKSRVFLNEPRAGGLTVPQAITVMSGEMDQDRIEVLVRIYVKPDTDAQSSWDLLDGYRYVAERLIEDGTSVFGRGTWSAPDYIADIDSIVTILSMTAPRDD